MRPEPRTSPRKRAGRPLTVAETTIPTVALLSSEPACTISTQTAGTVEFEATLTWQTPEEARHNHIIPLIRDLAGCGARSTLRETEDVGVWRVSGEIMALTEEELGSALDAVLRAVGEVAALSEAVVEMRAVRVASPREVPVRLVERLGRDLASAGFGVSFAPAWVASNGADLCVGCGGMREELEEFLSREPAWRVRLDRGRGSG